MEKRCFKCGTVKPLEEFYGHSQMADGHLGKCKECTKADNRSHRASNREYFLEYDRERQRDERRRAKKVLYQENYFSRNPDARREIAERYVRRYPEKYAAHVAVSNAVRDGILVKQPCEVCGRAEVEAHHDDYSKPLTVRWLCKEHHMEHHWRRMAA